jgi:starvation-inducible DNA-binding protein
MADSLKVVPESTPVKTGVREPEKVAKALSDTVADTYRLIFKTHAYHWNVEGPLFYSIHKLTEEQYEEMFDAVDEMAERVRALGQLTPATLKAIIEMSVVEDLGELPSARTMVEDLAKDHQRVAHRMHAAIDIAESGNDDVTADLLTARSAFHEKAAWMLRAIAAE